MITFRQIKGDEDIKTYIQKADESLGRSATPNTPLLT